ncbi:MAG TPA: hypothetical protein VE110_02365, partial [Gemmatimonadaceae bacterium]|nr:hypothetical protein [Gemmatimonadaceae bacterium]
VLTVSDSLTGQDSSKIEGLMTSGPGEWRDAPCDGCKQDHEVQIHVIGKTTDVKPGNGPSNRRIVAVIRNKSDEPVRHDSSQFIFQPNSYYLVTVSRGVGADANAKWGLVPFKIGADLRKVIGNLEGCGHRRWRFRRRPSDAAFLNCGDVHTASSRIHFVKTAYAAPQPLMASITKRGWISCDPDCCTGSGTYMGTQ